VQALKARLLCRRGYTQWLFYRKKALNDAKNFSKKLSLDMNFIDAYFYLDSSQLILYFLADNRVDFRELAKKLAQKYKTRIELRQIGVRDKAKKVGGLGPCGLFLCCNSFLNDFNSVSINMAKNQMLALNPSKINGMCGRLLCCLGYENDTYSELKKGLPKVGATIDTKMGAGKVVSVDATCTSLSKNAYEIDDNETWNSICTWGPTCLLPIFQMLGTKYVKKSMVSYMIDSTKKIDGFTKINFIYDNAIASLKVGKSVKSEGELIISGTNGCIYVPSPWWKTDYFEVHYENINENKRYFYQLDGEGIRNELLEFVSQIENGICSNAIDEEVSIAIAESISDFYNGKLDEIKFN